MDESKERSDSCRMHEQDAEGHTNLCCCYVMDETESVEDPCYTPVDDCCCC